MWLKHSDRCYTKKVRNIRFNFGIKIKNGSKGQIENDKIDENGPLLQKLTF